MVQKFKYTNKVGLTMFWRKENQDSSTENLRELYNLTLFQIFYLFLKQRSILEE